MRKIYLVITSSGTYEDYMETIECGFNDKSKAEEYAKQLDEVYICKPLIDSEEWYEIEDAVDELIDYSDPRFENPYSYHKDGERFTKRNYEVEAEENKVYLDIIHQHGYNDFTLEDLEKQRHWERMSCQYYHKTEVREVEIKD